MLSGPGPIQVRLAPAAMIPTRGQCQFPATGKVLFVHYKSKQLSAWLEPVLSHTDKSCNASYCRHFSTDIKIIINNTFVGMVLWPIEANKTGFNLIIFYFNIPDELSLIQCDKYIFLIFIPFFTK